MSDKGVTIDNDSQRQVTDVPTGSNPRGASPVGGLAWLARMQNRREQYHTEFLREKVEQEEVWGKLQDARKRNDLMPERLTRIESEVRAEVDWARAMYEQQGDEIAARAKIVKKARMDAEIACEQKERELSAFRESAGLSKEELRVKEESDRLEVLTAKSKGLRASAKLLRTELRGIENDKAEDLRCYIEDIHRNEGVTLVFEDMETWEEMYKKEAMAIVIFFEDLKMRIQARFDAEAN